MSSGSSAADDTDSHTPTASLAPPVPPTTGVTPYAPASDIATAAHYDSTDGGLAVTADGGGVGGTDPAPEKRLGSMLAAANPPRVGAVAAGATSHGDLHQKFGQGLAVVAGGAPEGAQAASGAEAAGASSSPSDAVVGATAGSAAASAAALAAQRLVAESKEMNTGHVSVKLFVGQVPRTMDEEELTGRFSVYGDIVEVVVIRASHRRYCPRRARIAPPQVLGVSHAPVQGRGVPASTAAARSSPSRSARARKPPWRSFTTR